MKTHGKTLIILLIICMAIQMMPALVFAVSDQNATATEEGQAITEKKDAPAIEAQADDNTDGKPEGGEIESKDSEEQTPGTASEDMQPLKETEPQANPDASEALLLKKAPLRAAAEGEQIYYTAARDSDSMEIVFKATINGQEYEGTCNELGVKHLTSGTMTLEMLGKDDLRRKVAWKYKSWHKDGSRNYSMGGVRKGQCLEAMLQYARAWMDDKAAGGSTNRTAVRNHFMKENGGNGWSASTADKIINAVKALDTTSVETLAIPENFRVCMGHVKNTASDGHIIGQDPVFWGNLVTSGESVDEGSGHVTLIKGTDSDELVNSLSQYSLAGAQYQIYTDSACTNTAKTADGGNALLTTNASGGTETLEMAPGKYWLKEVKSPGGHMLDQTPLAFTVTAGGTVTPTESPLKTGDSVDFKGWREGSGGGQTALFTATSGDKSYTGTCAQAGVALTATGKAKVTRIANDTKIAKAIYHFAYELSEDDNWWTSSHRFDNVGSIIGISGTQFSKRKMLECFCQIHNMGSQKWYDVCTDAGVAIATARAVRNYYENLNVSGVTVPDSFEIYLSIPTNSSQQFIMWRMTDAGQVILNVSDKGVYGKPNLRVFKTANGGNFSYSSLLGTKFAIKYYDVDTKAEIASAAPVRTWIFTTVKKDAPESAAAGTYWAGFDLTDPIIDGSDEFFTDKDGNRVMPLGWFTIEEIAAPSGFKLTDVKCYGHIYQANNGASATTVIEGSTSDSKLHMETFVFEDEAFNLTVSKKNSATGAELAGAQLQILQGSAVVVPTWTTTATPKVINDLGPGTYTLREIKAPSGFEVADDVTFTLDGKSDRTVTMSDAPVTVKTTAVDPNTRAHMGSRTTASKIADTVHMTGLVKDRKYRLTGTLMNKRTGQAVPNVTVSPKEFTATAAAMDVTMDFTFDSTALADGDSVVVFETLYRTSQVHSGETVPVELKKHQDINDEAQTVSYPSIKTTAAISDDRHTITDKINYTNLLPGKKYRFRGWLVDTASGTKVSGSDGTVDLTAGEDTSGSVAMKMDASGYDSIKGHSVTAFEELYIIETVDGKEKEVRIAEHKDRSGDASSNPQITELYQDLKIKKNVTGNLGDLTKVFEYTAEFTGLVPGRPYKIEGDDEKTFMADASGKASAVIRLKDGQTAVIRELPKGATYKVTEAASDHIAEYRLFSEDMEEKGAKIIRAEDSNGADAGKALSTAQETVDQFDGTVVILWENNRDLAAITGVNTDTGIWAAAFGAVLACLAAMVISIRKNRKKSL